MKKILTAVLLMCSLFSFSQSEKYSGAMQKNLAMMGTVKTTEEYQALAASFERIGEAEKTEWLPYYYAGLSLLIPAWADTKLDKDVNSGKVKTLADKADALIKDSSDRAEVLALRNMAATQQMLVDPQNRWMTNGQEAGAYLQHAEKISPKNPRLVYLKGAGVFGTPEQFGGGKAKAKPILENAVALFKAEQVKPMYPNWGAQQAEEMLAQCK